MVISVKILPRSTYDRGYLMPLDTAMAPRDLPVGPHISISRLDPLYLPERYHPLTVELCPAVITMLFSDLEFLSAYIELLYIFKIEKHLWLYMIV